MKFALIALMLASPASAADLLTLDFDNQSSRVVEAVSVYPMTGAGEIVDDNIGAIVDPIAPGDSRRLELSLVACGKVWARVNMADGEEITGQTDLCRNQQLIITD